jgi:hypothetical protein
MTYPSGAHYTGSWRDSLRGGGNGVYTWPEGHTYSGSTHSLTYLFTHLLTHSFQADGRPTIDMVMEFTRKQRTHCHSPTYSLT